MGDISVKFSEVRKMDGKSIVELLKKASDAEWKYILKLYIQVNDSYEVLHGDACFITTNAEDNDDYLEKIVIPKTMPVIIKHRHKTEEVVYVFTKDGWKTVNIS